MTTFVRSDVTAQKLGRTISPVVGTHLAGARERLLALGEKFWDRARDELIRGNQQSLSLAAVQQAIISHVDDAAPEAGVIARTEINRAANAGSILAMRQMLGDVPGSTKTWITSSGTETRESHLAVDGQRVPLHGKFWVGGEALDHPGEGGPANRVNCNCTMLYHFPDIKSPSDVVHSAARTIGFYTPTALLRRSEDYVDQAFVDGQWRDTNAIIDWQAGQDDFVSPITEEDARKRYPKAFQSSGVLRTPHRHR